MTVETQEKRALLLALSAVLAWSTVATAFKIGLQHTTPLQLLLLGTTVSTAVFWAAAVATGNTRLPRPAAYMLCLGCINPLVYYTVLFAAYDRLPAQIAQPVNYTWAIMLALLAVPVLGQRLNARTLLGLVVGYGGVVLLVTRGSAEIPADIDLFGVLLALLSTVLWALYWLLNTRMSDLPAVAVMAWSFTFALPLLAIACWWFDGWPVLTASTVGAGLWVGLIEMGLTFLLWQAALARTRNVGRIGQLIFLSPFLSLVFIHYVLGEDIHPSAILGLAVIVAGLLISGAPKSRHQSV